MSEHPHEEDGTADGDAGSGEPVDDAGPGEPVDDADGPRAELRRTKARLEAEADRAVTEFDQGVVDLLAWLLDTETRARIYVYLRQHPRSTSEEVADGTGLYPSTVREALAELHEEETVSREKRESDGAGNNPYEYEAIAPSNLVRGVVGEVQRELNTVFNLEDRLDRETETGPVTISIGGDGAATADDGGTSSDDTTESDRPDGGAEDPDDGGPVTIEVEDADSTDAVDDDDENDDDDDIDDGGDVADANDDR